MPPKKKAKKPVESDEESEEVAQEEEKNDEVIMGFGHGVDEFGNVDFNQEEENTGGNEFKSRKETNFIRKC